MMANEENIRKVIDAIRDEQNVFDMADWNFRKEDGDTEIPKYPPNVCGTPSCIGGWAEAFMRHEQKIGREVTIDDTEVSEWLGLNFHNGYDLFYPYVDGSMSLITRQEAIAHLEHIIATDEIDWSKFHPGAHPPEPED